ncbi:hypothetical protein [Diaphorobacter sp.]|uniref:hypothetical protein n=1 Tax=Diaphorobacter sp. TaxID=1934310 RepID=UPI003D0D1FC1
MMLATTLVKRGALGLALASLAGVAGAKLPPPTPEAQLKAAESAARSAWAGKVDAYKLCQAQDRAAAHYRRTAADARPAAATAACTDPGPFSFTPPVAKPPETAAAATPPVAGAAASPTASAASAAGAAAPAAGASAAPAPKS